MKRKTATLQPAIKQFPPRLAKGKIFVGPEYYGCVNTGMRPAILHSKFMEDHPSMVRGYRFAVGPELWVQEAVRRLVLGKVPAGQGFVESALGDWRVTFCKTYATAKTRLEFLAKEIVTWNKQQRAKDASDRTNDPLGLRRQVAIG
jgi:hypothetical protein